MAGRASSSRRDARKATSTTLPAHGRRNPDTDREDPESLKYTRHGVRTGEDFANLMSALMGDVIEGRIDINRANAAVNAGRQLLRIVEMSYRYGADGKAAPLALSTGRKRAG